jgi:L-ascorbate metabolism protein UlaG (beta-lactamase superfamily)
MAELLEGITWLGHDSFRIKGPEGVLYIDPWKVRGGEQADLILITHEHYDHFSAEDVAKLRKPDTTIVTTAAVPAYNPKKKFHPKAAGGVGFVVTIGERSIYHAGDTDAIPEMDAIKADVALLPVGGTYTMTASEAAQVANKIKPKLAVPMHWGDIIGSRADAELFAKQAQVPTEILEPSQ